MNPTRKPKKPKQVVDKPRKTNKPKKPKSMKKGGVRTSISIAPIQSVRPTMSDVQWERFYSTLETRPERKAAFYDSRMYAKYLLYSAYEKTCEIGDATSEACRNFIDKIENLIEKRKLKMNTRQPSQQPQPVTQRSQSHSSHLPPIREELQPPTTREKRLLKSLPPRQPQQQVRRLLSLPPQQPQQQVRRLLSLPPRQPQQHTQQMRRLSSLKALPQVRQSSRSSNK